MCVGVCGVSCDVGWSLCVVCCILHVVRYVLTEDRCLLCVVCCCMLSMFAVCSCVQFVDVCNLLLFEVCCVSFVSCVA